MTCQNRRQDLDLVGHPLLNRAGLWTVRHAFPVSEHTVGQYEIQYTHTGNLTLLPRDGSPMRIRGGDISILQPNTPHRCAYDMESPSTFIVMCVAPDPPFPCLPFASRKELETGLRLLREAGNCVVRGSPEVDTAYLALRAAVSRFGNKPKGSVPAWVLRGLLHQVFLYVLQSLSSTARLPRHAAVQRARRYLREHVSDHVSVRQVARTAGLSVARLHVLFHRETGETPADYRLRLRLGLAQRKLQNRDASVTDIAMELAFPSSQHFATCFKKHFGSTPSAYRRMSHKAYRRQVIERRQHVPAVL